MKQKILQALKTEYSNLGLSERALDGVASFIEKTVTDEAGIDAAIKEASVSALLKIYQSEMDSERRKASELQKTLAGLKKETLSVESQQKNDEHSEMAEMIKKLKADSEAMRAELDKSKSEARRAELLSGLRSALQKENRGGALLDIVLANPTIAEEDTLDTLTARYKDEYDAKYKALYGDGVMPPAGGYFAGGEDKQDFSGVVSRLRSSGVLPNKKD